jgi:hypothetical protein
LWCKSFLQKNFIFLLNDEKAIKSDINYNNLDRNLNS